MTAQVKISDLLFELESLNDEFDFFFHKPTGKFVVLGAEVYCGEGDDEALSDDIEASPDDYIELPRKFDIDEYQMMEDFINTLNDEKAVEKLSIAIRGKGAFRRFKDIADEFDLLEPWYRFRDEGYKSVAKLWCEDNELELVRK